jgi:Zn-dependent protease
MSIKIGKVSGIDIKLNYSWLFIFLIITTYLPSQYPGKGESFYWGIGAASALFLYISSLIHELAHSTVAKRNGLGINSITLHFFGGVSEINEESSEIIGGVLLSISNLFGNGLPDYLEAVIFYGGYVNIALALFNLIPAFPMDGGRVFRALLWARNGDIVKSTRTASGVAGFISALFMGLGFLSLFSGGAQNGLWLLFIGIFINNSSKAGLSQTIISEALGEMHVRDMMTHDVRSVGPDITLQRLIEEWFNVYKHQGYPVIQDGELVGIVTNEDVRKVALLKMAKNNVGRLPVVEDGKLVGIITRSDFNKVIQMKTQFK